MLLLRTACAHITPLSGCTDSGCWLKCGDYGSGADQNVYFLYSAEGSPLAKEINGGEAENVFVWKLGIPEGGSLVDGWTLTPDGTFVTALNSSVDFTYTHLQRLSAAPAVTQMPDDFSAVGNLDNMNFISVAASSTFVWVGVPPRYLGSVNLSLWFTDITAVHALQSMFLVEVVKNDSWTAVSCLLHIKNPGSDTRQYMCEQILPDLHNPVKVLTHADSFAVLYPDGTVQASSVGALSSVSDLFVVDGVYYALVNNTIQTWGALSSETTPVVPSHPFNFVPYFGNTIFYANAEGGVVLNRDSTVSVWGDGSHSTVQTRFADVENVYVNSGAFVLLHSDMTVTAWGKASCGGDSSSVDHLFGSVVSQIATHPASRAFAVLNATGHIITWGGGDAYVLNDLQQSWTYSRIIALPTGFVGQRLDDVFFGDVPSEIGPCLSIHDTQSCDTVRCKHGWWKPNPAEFVCDVSFPYDDCTEATCCVAPVTAAPTPEPTSAPDTQVPTTSTGGNPQTLPLTLPPATATPTAPPTAPPSEPPTQVPGTVSPQDITESPPTLSPVTEATVTGIPSTPTLSPATVSPSSELPGTDVPTTETPRNTSTTTPPLTGTPSGDTISGGTDSAFSGSTVVAVLVTASVFALSWLLYCCYRRCVLQGSVGDNEDGLAEADGYLVEMQHDKEPLIEMTCELGMCTHENTVLERDTAR